MWNRQTFTELTKNNGRALRMLPWQYDTLFFIFPCTAKQNTNCFPNHLDKQLQDTSTLEQWYLYYMVTWNILRTHEENRPL